jgi:hypothetical protein
MRRQTRAVIRSPPACRSSRCFRCSSVSLRPLNRGEAFILHYRSDPDQPRKFAIIKLGAEH